MTRAPSCRCTTGWTGADCTELACPTFRAQGCASHGSCMIRSADEARVCSCDAGWAGEACEFPLCASAPLSGCSNRGVCGCQPNATRFPHDGPGPVTSCAFANRTKICICESGFAGTDCSQTCPTDAAGSVCGEHGRCVAGVRIAVAATLGFPAGLRCACDAGWSGLQCTVPVCPSLEGEECGGARGECLRTQGGASCRCKSGFRGENCGGFQCPNDCSGVGRCELLGEAPACRCAFGYGGDDCATNAGMVSLAFSLGIAGGLLLLALCIGSGVNYLRASRSGSLVGPTDAYRQRQWERSASVVVGGSLCSVHTPNRGVRTPR